MSNDELTKQLADMIVNVAKEGRNFTSEELEHFNWMLDKALDWPRK